MIRYYEIITFCFEIPLILKNWFVKLKNLYLNNVKSLKLGGSISKKSNLLK